MVKVLVFGGSGLVGSRFIQLNKDNFELAAPDTSQADILDKNQLLKILKEFEPQVVINFAAYTDVQAAEKQQGNKNGLCYKLNADGAKNVAEVCKEFSKHLIHISTDYVFDGQKSAAPYTEEDIPNPQNWYGQTKFYGEENVKNSGAYFVIVRISMPYVAHYSLKKDVARFFLEQLKMGKNVLAINDQKITPTLGDDIANALAEISNSISLGTKKSSIYHVSVTDDTTPFDFAVMIGQAFNLNTSLIKAVSLDKYNKNKAVKLLRYSRLNPQRFIAEYGGNIPHTVEENIKYFKQMVDSNS